jgi:outer membrane murein-binding lipoprotein Lpp
LAALGLLVAGCGSSASVEQQVRTLRDEVTRLQDSQDRLEERLSQAENAAARQRSRSEPDAFEAPESAGGSQPFRPELTVVKLEPSAKTNEQAAESSAPAQKSLEAEQARPLISGEGEQIRADFLEDSPSKAPARKQNGR